MSKAFEAAFSEEDLLEEEMDEFIKNLVKELQEESEDTYVENTIDISCIKENNKWYIAEVDMEMLDIVVSGFYSTLGQMFSEE